MLVIGNTGKSLEGKGSDKKEVIPLSLRNVKPEIFLLVNVIPFHWEKLSLIPSMRNRVSEWGCEPLF